MNSDKYEGPTTQILNAENLQKFQTIRDNRSLINRDLLEQNFSFPTTQSVNINNGKLEPTVNIDLRVKKFNEIDERLKKLIKNSKKQFKQTDQHCDIHRKVDTTESRSILNEFIERDFAVPDIESVLRRDEIVFQQHASNIEKIEELMATVKGYNYNELTLPAAEEVNEALEILREV